MHYARNITSSLLASLGALVFILLTSTSLPPIVASHFDGGGSPNGFMPRTMYIVVLAVIAFVVPFLLSVIPIAAGGRAGQRLNLPNKAYWLDPSRRDSTLAYLAGHARIFAYVVVIFLCYVHFLVVRANASRPVHLSSAALITGLVVFFTVLLAWLAVLFRRFRKPI